MIYKKWFVVLKTNYATKINKSVVITKRIPVRFLLHKTIFLQHIKPYTDTIPTMPNLFTTPPPLSLSCTLPSSHSIQVIKCSSSPFHSPFPSSPTRAFYTSWLFLDISFYLLLFAFICCYFILRLYISFYTYISFYLYLSLYILLYFLLCCISSLYLHLYGYLFLFIMFSFYFVLCAFIFIYLWVSLYIWLYFIVYSFIYICVNIKIYFIKWIIY